MKARKHKIDAETRDRICYLVTMMSLFARRGPADPVRCAMLVHQKAWAKSPEWVSHLQALPPPHHPYWQQS